MSANRDRSQRITFVYSNLYRMYQTGKDAAQDAKPSEAPGLRVGDIKEHVTHAIIKTGDRRVVDSYQPMTLIARKPESLGIQLTATAQIEKEQLEEQHNALSSLKQNLQTLNNLHERLRFMLKELEEITKE